MPSLPYMTNYSRIKTALEKIKAAATPERFTQEYLAETLNMKGGSARPIIPFLKRIGFLGTDGSPTATYKEFRNESKSGAAAAAALRRGYAPLFEMNEKAHELSDNDLKGLIVQATGSEKDSGVVSDILGSFKIVKSFANFKQTPLREHPNGGLPTAGREMVAQPEDPRLEELGLSYTINLNLPATSDITVFNAIFKSLKDNLLSGGRRA